MKEDWQRQDKETVIWISLAIALVCAASAAVILGVNGWIPILIIIFVFLAVFSFMILVFRRFIFLQNELKPDPGEEKEDFLVVVAPWLFPRKAKFMKCRRLIQTILNQLYQVNDFAIKAEIRQAMLATKGLLKNFESKTTNQGRIEEKLPALLQNISNLIATWIGHESGEFPLRTENAQAIRNALLSTKDLVWKYQEDGLDQASRYLASLFELQTDMQSSGINPNQGK